MLVIRVRALPTCGLIDIPDMSIVVTSQCSTNSHKGRLLPVGMLDQLTLLIREDKGALICMLLHLLIEMQQCKLIVLLIGLLKLAGKHQYLLFALSHATSMLQEIIIIRGRDLQGTSIGQRDPKTSQSTTPLLRKLSTLQL